MSIKPTIVLRAILAGGVAVFAKIGTAMKAAGGLKVGAAAAAVTAATTAALPGTTKSDSKNDPQSS